MAAMLIKAFHPSLKHIVTHNANRLGGEIFASTKLLNLILGRNIQTSIYLKNEAEFIPPPKKSKNMYTVTYLKSSGEKVIVKGREGRSLLDIVTDNNLELDGFGACEGSLSCSTCHLVLKKGDYDKVSDTITDEEIDMLDVAFGITDTRRLNCLSLSGGGFLGLYLIGAVEYIQQNQAYVLKDAAFAGSSSGALVASALACDMPLKNARQLYLKAAAAAGSFSVGTFNHNFSIEAYLREGLCALPLDAHLRANGRLYVSLTRVTDFENVLVSNWRSRDELIECVLCSCFIPGFSGKILPTFRGTYYIDGGYSNGLPVPLPNTLTVSPFFHADICPSYSLSNQIFSAMNYSMLSRYYHAIMPLSPHEMMKYYWEGFKDANTYFKYNA